MKDELNFPLKYILFYYDSRLSELVKMTFNGYVSVPCAALFSMLV